MTAKKKYQNSNDKIFGLLQKNTLLIILAFVFGIIIANIPHDNSDSSVVDDSGATTETDRQNQEESERVLEQLDAILLTEESNPTVVRIDDPAPLREKDPDFYKNASAGDHLIIFPSQGVIFRSSEGRIINLAPIINTSSLPEVGDTE